MFYVIGKVFLNTMMNALVSIIIPFVILGTMGPDGGLLACIIFLLSLIGLTIIGIKNREYCS